jgi:hypothetical protein
MMKLDFGLLLLLFMLAILSGGPTGLALEPPPAENDLFVFVPHRSALSGRDIDRLASLINRWLMGLSSAFKKRMPDA